MKIKLVLVFSLSLFAFNHAIAGDQMTLNIIGKIITPELKTKAIKVNTIPENGIKSDRDISMNLKSLEDRKNPFYTEGRLADSSLLQKKAMIELNHVVRIIRQNLEKKGFAISEENADVSIFLISDGLYYDSISEESLNSIDYSIQEDGKEIFSGRFEQKADCSRFFGFSKCKNNAISKILFKRILKNLKEKKAAKYRKKVPGTK